MKLDRTALVGFLRTHALALCAALIVGSFSVAPHLLAVHALGTQYQGYPFMYEDDEDIYMSRVQEVLDGHPSVGSPVLYEYKNTWSPLMPAAEYLYAAGPFLGISLVATMVAMKFILPAILFLLIYALVFRLTRKTGVRMALWSAIAGGFFVTLAYDLVDYNSALRILLGTSPHLHLSVWTRPINPIAGALILFSTLLVLWNFFDGKYRWTYTLLGSLLFGISISYFFGWFLGGACIGLSLAYFLWRQEWQAVRHLSALIVGSILFQANHWYHTLFGLHGETGHALALHNGAIFTHTPILNKVLFLTTLLFGGYSAYVAYRSKSIETFERWWWFCLVLLIAAWSAFTEQIVTGMTVWPYHFVQYTIPFCGIVCIVLGTHILAPRMPRVWGVLIGLIICISLLFSVRSVQTYPSMLADFSMRQSYMPLFAWVNAHTQTDCVILVDEETDHLARLIPAFTHCNVYTSSYIFFGVPEERILHNYLLHLRLVGVTPSTVATYLKAHPGEINAYFFVDIPQSLSEVESAQTIKSANKIKDAYPLFYAHNPIEELKTYKIEYVLAPKNSSLQKNLPGSSAWPLVFSTESWSIYAVATSTATK